MNTLDHLFSNYVVKKEQAGFLSLTANFNNNSFQTIVHTSSGVDCLGLYSLVVPDQST